MFSFFKTKLKFIGQHWLKILLDVKEWTVHVLDDRDILLFIATGISLHMSLQNLKIQKGI